MRLTLEDMPVNEVQPVAHLRGDPTACLYRTGERSVRIVGTWPAEDADWWLNELRGAGYAVDQSELRKVP